MQNEAKVQAKNNLRITEIYHPKYRKGDFDGLVLKNSIPFLTQSSDKIQKYQSNVLSGQIISQFNKLRQKIESLGNFIETRLQIHEQQLIKIAHDEIKKIQVDCQKTIKTYNKIIQEKNMNQEILDLKYQIKYYQTRACEIYQQNRIYEVQIKRLKQQILKLKMDDQCCQAALKNVSKKYLKQKCLKSQLAAKMNPQSPLSINLSPVRPNLIQNSSFKSHKFQKSSSFLKAFSRGIGFSSKKQFDTSNSKIQKTANRITFRLKKIHTQPMKDISFD